MESVCLICLICLCTENSSTFAQSVAFTFLYQFWSFKILVVAEGADKIKIQDQYRTNVE